MSYTPNSADIINLILQGSPNVEALISGNATVAGKVGSVAAADGSITVAGTATAPTISRAALTGDVTAGAGSNAQTLVATSNVNSIIAANSTVVAKVASVTAADGSITIGGTATSPTVSRAALTGDVVASAGSNATAIKSSVGLTGVPTAPTGTVGDNSTQIATDAFVTTAVNNAIAGVNPAVAVQAATTAAGDTSAWTYNNGVSGVGATFTGPTNTAITIDGYTFTATGQRLLVKNDTQSPSGAFNGIYFLTALQTAGTGAIFTRALDYDQPSDINNTGAIPVISGTVNGSTSWVETAQVVSVGVTPLAFTLFSLNPTTLITNSTAASGDLSGTYPGPTVAKVQGVAITVAEATLLSQTNNATTRSATATLNPGEETVFTGSTASQTLTLPAAPQASSINTLVNLASVNVTLAAGSGDTVNSFGTTGSITVVPKASYTMVYIGSTWYVMDANVVADTVGAMATSVYDPAAIAQQVVGTTATQTLTNKRDEPRVITSSGPGATPSMNTDNADLFQFTSLAAAITSMTTNLTGTPVAGEMKWIQFRDNGTARAITWGAKFGSSTVTLPTTTVISTTLNVGLVWDTTLATPIWVCVAVA